MDAHTPSSGSPSPTLGAAAPLTTFSGLRTAGLAPTPGSGARMPVSPGIGFSGEMSRGAMIGWFVLLLLVGLAARAGLSLRPGLTDDTELFEAWLRGAGQHGLSGFYDQVDGANYPPLHILTLRAQAWLLEQAGVDLVLPESSRVIRVFLRAPACAADVLIALVLYGMCARRWGRRAGLGGAALYFLNPVSLYVSAYWGQVDSIHTFFVLAGLASLNRDRPLRSGLAIGLAMLQKFQSITFLPLFIFDAYRWRGLRGVCALGAGFVLSACAVMAPFAAAGSDKPEGRLSVAKEALERGYLRVLGQYPRLSINAYNLWHVGNHHLIGDRNPPRILIKAAASGQTSVAQDAKWYLQLTWRRIGSILFVLFVATVLAIYARRHLPEDRALAAGLLGLTFFLFPTEMHERYAYPVIAVLVPWAVVGAWRERWFWGLSVLLLLNLTGPLPVTQITSEVSVGVLLLFTAGMLMIAVGPAGVRGGAALTGASGAAALAALTDTAGGPPARRVLVTWFCRLTFLTWVAVLNVACVLVYLGSVAAWPREGGVVYLSELPARSARQQYASVQADAEVDGGPLFVGGRYYFRGLGTHASARVVYDVPPGYTRFRSLAGVNGHFGGVARVKVLVDGELVQQSDPLSAVTAPFEVDVDVSAARELILIVEPNGPNTGDHVDWADARFVK